MINDSERKAALRLRKYFGDRLIVLSAEPNNATPGQVRDIVEAIQRLHAVSYYCLPWNPDQPPPQEDNTSRIATQ